LREGSQTPATLQLASSKPFAPAYPDSRRATNFSANGIPSPPDRPYRLGEGARDVPPVEAQTTELAAATRPRTTEPATSPVSVYVPTRYDGRAGFMGGRGLY
jgi:hypothetical protein